MSRTTSSSGCRRSTVKNTEPGTTLREFGRFSISPTVATPGAYFRPIRSTASIIRAAPSSAFLRRCIGIVTGVRVLPGERRLVPAHRLHAGDDADILFLGLEDRPLLDVQLEECRQRMLAAGFRPAVADRVERLGKGHAVTVLLRLRKAFFQSLGKYARGHHRRG